MGGKTTLKTRQNALWDVFSEWVRRKDAVNGIARCVTCGKLGGWSEMDAGHFWKRQHQSTRYDPHNVAVQCTRCNRFRGGAEAEHAAYIIREHGLEVFEELERRHTQVKKWRPEEIENLILYYKQKIKELDDTCK